MGAGEVIASYHDLWRVEQSFRMSKTDLRARPMFVHTRDAIDAHLTVVFTALAVSREVQQRTGLDPQPGPTATPASSAAAPNKRSRPSSPRDSKPRSTRSTPESQALTE